MSSIRRRGIFQEKLPRKPPGERVSVNHEQQNAQTAKGAMEQTADLLLHAVATRADESCSKGHGTTAGVAQVYLTRDV